MAWRPQVKGSADLKATGKSILFSRKDDWETGIRAALAAHSPDFVEFEHADPERYDLVMPLTLKDARHFNRHFAHLNRVKALVPADAAIDACDDKQAFARCLLQAGFARFLPGTGDDLPYPYLLKKHVSEWGVDTYIINGPGDEDEHRERMESGQYLKQEYVFGQKEYTAHLLVAGGRVRFMRTLEFAFTETLFVKGQSFAHASQEFVDHRHLSALFESILNCLGFQGICCFNYKLRGDTPKIFEINPRQGASLTCFLGEAVASLQGALRGSRASLASRLWRRGDHTRE